MMCKTDSLNDSFDVLDYSFDELSADANSCANSLDLSSQSLDLSSHSLDFNSSLLDNSLSSVKKRRPRQRRKRRRKNDRMAGLLSDGFVIPADSAFVDVALQESNDVSFSDNLFDIISERRTKFNKQEKILNIRFHHKILYRGEVIFCIETETVCTGSDIWGQSSKCSLKDGNLIVKVTNKSSKIESTAKHENGRDKVVCPLAELLKLSSNARENEMMTGSVHQS